MRVFDEWLLTPFRLAIHEPTATAVIADVHLGYREARRQTGDAVPLLDLPTQLAPLHRARRRFTFDSLVVAGDLFERGADRDLLRHFLRELELLHVVFAGLTPGNHDRGWEELEPLAPLHPDGLRLGDWRVVHQEEVNGATALPCVPGSDRIVLGHWHPAVRFQGRRVPCYLADSRRIVLPAFSADAAGGAVHLQSDCRGSRCFAIADGRVVEYAAAAKNENPRRRLRGFRRATGSARSTSRYQ